MFVLGQKNWAGCQHLKTKSGPCLRAKTKSCAQWTIVLYHSKPPSTYYASILLSLYKKILYSRKQIVIKSFIENGDQKHPQDSNPQLSKNFEGYAGKSSLGTNQRKPLRSVNCLLQFWPQIGAVMRMKFILEFWLEIKHRQKI